MYLEVEKNFSMHTVRAYASDILTFLIWLKGKEISELSHADIKQYIVFMQKFNYSKTTTSRKIASLRTFFNYLYREKITDLNPVKGIHSPKKTKSLPKFLTEEETEKQIRLYEESGIIKGYRAMIDKNKAKAQTVTALIEIRVQPKFGHGFDEIAGRIAALEEVESIYLMSGGFDLCCMVSDKSFEEIALFVANRLSPLDGVMSTATHFILKKYKEQGVYFTEPPKDDRGILSF